MNFAWTGDEAHFDVTTSHHLEQLDGFTVSEGRINLTPAVDTRVSFNGTWRFAWPGAIIGWTAIDLNVIDLATEDVLAQASAIGGNGYIFPPFGTLHAQSSGLLPAGGQYMLYYNARVSHDHPPAGLFGDASGDIHFTLTPVPEPATLLLLLLVGAMLRGRGPRRSRRQERSPQGPTRRAEHAGAISRPMPESNKVAYRSAGRELTFASWWA